jgi:hypothetical protein
LFEESPPVAVEGDCSRGEGSQISNIRTTFRRFRCHMCRLISKGIPCVRRRNVLRVGLIASTHPYQQRAASALRTAGRRQELASSFLLRKLCGGPSGAGLPLMYLTFATRIPWREYI